MTSIERQISPEPRERLPPGEVLIFPKPGLFIMDIRYATFRNIYSKYINPSYLSHGEDLPEGAMPQILDYIGNHVDEFNQEFSEQEKIVAIEYDGLLSSLRKAVGDDRIRLVGYTWPETNTDNKFLAAFQQRAGYYDQQVSHMQSVMFPTGERFQCFPRDMFTRFGQLIFVNPHAFPRFRDTEFYKMSFLGEGGMLVQAQNAVILSEKFQENSNARKDIKALEQRGYKVAFVPPVRSDKQLPDRQKFSTYHIDSHCALVIGRDKNLYFLFALSYAAQNRKTYELLVRAAQKVGAQPCLVDDRNQTHMGFNFVQLRDGTVVYPSTGRWEGENYHPSNLDGALIEIVGLENLIMTRELNHIPRLTKAGLRCMTNIAPSNFVDHLIQTTTLSLPDLEL